MNEFINKLIERLEEASHWEESTFDEDGCCNDDSEEVVYLYRAIEIVNQLAEEYNGGWIPCSERLPKERREVLVWDSNQEMHCVAWYNPPTNIWYSNDFEIADSKFIIAWRPLPTPYHP